MAGRVPRLAFVLTLLLAGVGARAEAPVDLGIREDVEERDAPRALLELTGIVVTGTIWYWANTNLNAQDWGVPVRVVDAL